MNRVELTREELRAIPQMHKQMVKDVERLHELEAKAVEVRSSCSGNADRVQTSVTSRAGIYVEAAADLRKELEARDADLKLWKSYAEDWISELPDEKITDKQIKRVLTYRYVKAYSWELIAELVGLTLRRVHQIDAEALSVLDV